MNSMCLYISEFDRRTICNILSSSIKLDTYDVWIKFCKCLDRENFQSTFHHSEDNSFYWTLDQLLGEWCNKKAEQSRKINDLLQVLDNCELWDESDTIRETFSLPPRDTTLPAVFTSDEILKQLGDYVSDHCSSLLDSTKISNDLLTYLEEVCSSHVSPSSWNIIKEESTKEGVNIPCSTECLRFYSALRSNPKCIKCVIIALEKDKQYQPAWTLRRSYFKFDIVETVFIRLASNPYDVNTIINRELKLEGNKENQFSDVFHLLFPDYGGFSPAMKSFLGILPSFRFNEGSREEIKAVKEIYQELNTPSDTNTDGIFQFWVYLVKLYPILRDKHRSRNSSMIFNFMNGFPIEQTRVVILGQYLSPNCRPSGFAYNRCVSNTTKQILENLNFELKLLDKTSTMPNKLEIPTEILKKYKQDCILDGWVKQGVLMFNAWLTSHENIWSIFTDFLIKHLSTNYSSIAFIMTGRVIALKTPLIDQNKHVVFNVYLKPEPKEFQWDVILPFVNTNFYLYQVTKNVSSMIDWSNVLSKDDGYNGKGDQVERLSKYKDVFDKLLNCPTPISKEPMKYFIKHTVTMENQETQGNTTDMLTIEALPQPFDLTKHDGRRRPRSFLGR